jgi:hypothetical protein
VRPYRRSNTAVYSISGALKRTIRQSPETLSALARPHGLTQGRISEALHGLRFGPRLRDRFDQLGVSLGLEPGVSVRRVGQRRSP